MSNGGDFIEMVFWKTRSSIKKVFQTLIAVENSEIMKNCCICANFNSNEGK